MTDGDRLVARLSRVRLRLLAQAALAGGVQALALVALAGTGLLGLLELGRRAGFEALASSLGALDPRAQVAAWLGAGLLALAAGAGLAIWRKTPSLGETARLCDQRTGVVIGRPDSHGDRVFLALHLSRLSDSPWMKVSLAQALAALMRLEPARVWPWSRPGGTVALVASVVVSTALLGLGSPGPAHSQRIAPAGKAAHGERDTADPALLGAERRLGILLDRLLGGRAELVSGAELAALTELAGEAQARDARFEAHLRALGETLSETESTRALGRGLSAVIAKRDLGAAKAAAGLVASTARAAGAAASQEPGAAAALSQSLLHAATRLGSGAGNETPPTAGERTLSGLEPATGVAGRSAPSPPSTARQIQLGEKPASGFGPPAPHDAPPISGDLAAKDARRSTHPFGDLGSDRRLRRLRRDLEQAASVCTDPRLCPAALEELGRALGEHLRSAREGPATRLGELAEQARRAWASARGQNPSPDGASEPAFEARAAGTTAAGGAAGPQARSGATEGGAAEKGHAESSVASGSSPGVGPGTGPAAGANGLEPSAAAVPALYAGQGRPLGAAVAEGSGASRAEVIEAAATEGFSPTSYAPVFRAYEAAVEEVLDDGHVPADRRQVVHRYFELIRPRTGSPHPTPLEGPPTRPRSEAP